MGAGRFIVKTILHAVCHVRHIRGAIDNAAVEMTIFVPLDTFGAIVPFCGGRAQI